MDYKIDRRMRLLIKEKRELYSWAIQEFDDRGQQLGEDQIPWGWTLDFTATELVLGDSLTIKEEGKIEGRIPQKEEIAHRRRIRAKLRPGDPRDDRDWFRRTKYRMFGADREIQKFELNIVSLGSEDEQENCEAWAMVGYTDTDDYPRLDEDDVVAFNLLVKPSTFERYAARISNGTADEVILSVGRVDGFYAAWSPGIDTREVKVLAAGEEQVVETPDSKDYAIPRIGAVGDVDLYINAKRAQARNAGDPETADENEITTTPLVRPEAAVPGAIDLATTKALKGLATSAKWIIGLLVVLIIATFLRR